MASSKTYVVAWDGAIDNVLDISRQLVEGAIPHKFYNVSSVENQTEFWSTAEDVRYYGHFFNSIKDFLSTEHDVFIFNAGDMGYSNYAEYTKRIEKMFEENYNLALFAPDCTNDVFVGNPSTITKSKKYPELYLSTNTNGIYVAMSRDMAGYVSMFQDWSIATGEVDFTKMRSGWGLDMAYCSLAIFLNKIIYRDSSVTMYHPTSQSYSQQQGLEEFYMTLNSFNKFAMDVLMIRPERIKYIIDKTLEKVRNSGSVTLSKEIMYTNPKAVENA
jgi:hypothetical protein